MTQPIDTNRAAAPSRSVDLSSVARLELGLTALTEGNVPAAAAALAAIPEADWQAIIARFPTLPAWIAAEVNR